MSSHGASTVIVVDSSCSASKRPLPSSLSDTSGKGPSETKRIKINNTVSCSNESGSATDVNKSKTSSPRKQHRNSLSHHINNIGNDKQHGLSSLEERDQSAESQPAKSQNGIRATAAVAAAINRDSSPSTLRAESSEPDAKPVSSRSKLVPFPKGGELQRLEVCVEASECELGYESRMRYLGKVYLHLGYIAPEPVYCGFIDGFVVDKNKASTRAGQSATKAWIVDWLKPGMTRYEYADEEMAASLRCLYKKTGAPRTEDSPGADDSIVFIELLSIKPETTVNNVPVRAEGQSLLKHLFELYYQCLTDAQMPCAQSLTDQVFVALEPGLPSDMDIARKWYVARDPHETDDELFDRVSTTLERIYSSSSIGFQTVAKDKKFGQNGHTAMVRKTSLEDMRRGILLENG
ncbi:hypothetical protein BD289DRAFT_452611 [Coniella lustricola]|uniref:Uncharacterized protein n=1 Tax=Coniella lustricola TaxID=2025994 RepID=A0A2T3AAG9_9PEZI|nr:hypothetical protein BD289DRAFT_452611 [Coniella lustricola]